MSESFAAMVRDKKSESLDEWIQDAGRGSFRELGSFAASLRRDEQAVRAALTLYWSNGPVEGHVNRLKFIKRFDVRKSQV